MLYENAKLPRTERKRLAETILFDFIEHLKKEGLSMLLVEQNVPLSLKVSDYVYVLNKGKIVHQCTKNELVENEQIQTEYIGVSQYGRN